VDTPSVNFSNPKSYTLSELTEALEKVYAKQPKLDKFVLYGSKAIMDRIGEAITQEWKLIQCVQTPCPNCEETALDGHCQHCDYPYHEK